jgi:hypothetical protein
LDIVAERLAVLGELAGLLFEDGKLALKLVELGVAGLCLE